MKDKKILAVILISVILLIALAFGRSSSPKPVEWSPTFYNTKTDPYGTYITYQLLDNIFEKKNIRTTRMPIYNNLKDDVQEYIYHSDNEYTYKSYDEDYYQNELYAGVQDTITDSTPPVKDTIQTTVSDPTEWYRDIEYTGDTTSYLFINTTFSIDQLDMIYLLDFVGLGNNVFISAEKIDYKLLDTLKIKVDTKFFQTDTIYTLIDYPQKKYKFSNIQRQVKFNTDSCKLKVKPLALNNNNDTVFIDITYGMGHIYLHTVPSAFANVNMLQEQKYDFGFRCLSYLPQNSKIIWDEFQKQGITNEDNMFRIVLDSPPLRMALYIILLGFLLFMVFRSKRMQRAIPIITPPVNSSLEFLGTLSNLYYRKNDFKTILLKRHAYFLDFIRKHYYLSTENPDTEFITVLSAKSGMDKEKLNSLFFLYNDLSTLAYIENQPFLRYNSLLEEFYNTVKINKK